MKVVIIEDEKPAAEKLQKSLQKIDESIEILAVLGSVKDSLQWLREHKQPEVMIAAAKVIAATATQPGKAKESKVGKADQYDSQKEALAIR